MDSSEQSDEARFARLHREYEKKRLDEVQVYQDVHAVEESRQLEGKPPKVRFLTEQEQREWQRQYPGASSGTGSARSEKVTEGKAVSYTHLGTARKRTGALLGRRRGD